MRHKNLILILFILFHVSFAFSQSFYRSPAYIEGTTTTAKAAGTTALTAASQTQQSFTGTSAQTVDLPDAYSLDLGRKFYIYNAGSAGNITVEDFGNNVLGTVYPLTAKIFYLRAKPDSNGTWSVLGVTASGDFTGILPIANGGTNNSTFVTDGVSFFDGTSLTSDASFTFNAGLLTVPDVAVSTALQFTGGSGGIIEIIPPASVSSYTMTLPSSAGASNTVLKSSGSATLSFAKVDLTTDVTGRLPIANGGTNSSVALNNNRVMISSSNAIVEASAITANRALISDANGIPTHSTTTSTELGYLAGITNTAGGLVYGNGTTLVTGSAGTAQQWMLSNGTSGYTYSNTTTTGKIIDGSADEIQLTVQGNGTQTSDIFIAEESTGTDIIRATNSNAIIRGTQTNDNAAAGYVGEYAESIVSTLTNFASSTTFTDCTSLTLAAGDWDLIYILYYELGAGTMTRTRMGIGTASGTSTTGLSFGNTAVEALGAVASVTGMNASVTGVRKSISGSTTFYAKVAGTYSGGTPQFTCRLSARRVR